MNRPLSTATRHTGQRSKAVAADPLTGASPAPRPATGIKASVTRPALPETPKVTGGTDITRLLLAFEHGDEAALNDLLPLIYAELHRIARRQLRRMRPGDTLGTTGLVHEAYIKLVGQHQADWQDRHHFFSIAARAMRQILVNYATRKRAQKRGGGRPPLDLDEARLAAPEPEAQLLELDAALRRIEELDPRLPRIVECRFFAGMNENETAAALGVSVRTVQRDWKLARSWLREELRGLG